MPPIGNHYRHNLAIYAADDGRAAVLYDFLHMDLSDFNVRAVPLSAAKTEQKLLTQTGTEAWLFEILQDGAVIKSTSSYGDQRTKTTAEWDANGMQIFLDDAYDAYLQSSEKRREYKPRSKEWWSRDLRKIMNGCVSYGRPRTDNLHRERMLTFRPLVECRAAYGKYMHADDIEWEPAGEPVTDIAIGDKSANNAKSKAERDEADVGTEWEPDPDFEWERDQTDVDLDDWEPDPDADFEPDVECEAAACDSFDTDVTQDMP